MKNKIIVEKILKYIEKLLSYVDGIDYDDFTKKFYIGRGLRV